MSRAPISLADRLRAMVLLEPAGEATTNALLDMLRPQESQGLLRPSGRRAAGPLSIPPHAPDAEDLLKPGPPPADEPPPQRPLAYSPSQGATRVTPLPRRPLVIGTTAAVNPLDLGGVTPVREPMPLIAAHRARAVLAALASVQVAAGPIDIETLFHRITLGLPLARLPRRRVWSLSRGAQLLVDCGVALMPLAHDIDGIEHRLQAVVGSDRLERLYFAGCPGRGTGQGQRSTWETWRPPPAGVPVVLLTDLGCAGPRANADWAAENEWRRFADQARSAGARLVALVPYPVARIPASLAKRIAIVPWSETLSAGRVRRVLHDAYTTADS